MATAHIESKKEEIKKRVLMPGDPMRAKYIASKFLEDAKCINDVRGMLGFTGFYKGVEVTVFGSGMGGPSIGIYAYELYHFYDVDRIIRIGSCGASKREVKVRDLVLADSAYTLSSYPKLFFNDTNKVFDGDKKVLDLLEEKAKEKGSDYHRGLILTSDIFDVYVNKEEYEKNYPENFDPLACEMECAILYSIAKHLKKEAGCILTVVDSSYSDEVVSSEDREKALDEMIEIALDAVIA